MLWVINYYRQIVLLHPGFILEKLNIINQNFIKFNNSTDEDEVGGEWGDGNDEETEVVEADNGCGVEMAVTSNSAATLESVSASSLPRQPHPESATVPALVIVSAAAV